MLVSTAYAQAGGGGGSDMLTSLMPLLLIFAVFWFFLIRPQQKRQKEHRAKVAAVRRGDQVITAGGVHGKITKVVDDYTIQVEIAKDVKVKIATATLTDVIGRGEGAKTVEKKSDDAKDSDDGGGGDKKAVAGSSKKPLFSFGSKK